MKPSEANANANSVMPSKRKFANAQLQNRKTAEKHTQGDVAEQTQVCERPAPKLCGKATFIFAKQK